MKKLVGVVFLFVLVISFALAQSGETGQSSEFSSESSSSGIDKAYQCLRDSVDEKESSSLSLQEAIFSTLALGSDSKLDEAIESERNGNCWPKSSCSLKDTAQVLLAHDRTGKNTDDIESFLLSKNTTAQDLSWFIVVDITSREQSSCTLSYLGTERTITIGEDMKISGNPGSCLSTIPSGFWLEIKNSCLDEEYQISCDQDFVTTTLYQQSSSDTVFVSPNTHSSPSSGTTIEKVNSRCFSQGGSCDYEGSLWSALALQKTGHDISSFVPYLLALSAENQRFFPSSFLFMITTGEDQFTEITQSQKSSEFWQAPGTKYNKFYDTALATLALHGTSAIELENAKSYLLDVQTPQGCWNNNNIRDTAFLLYSTWPKNVPSSGSSGGGSVESCQVAGFSCESRFACLDAGGAVQNNYACDSFGQICCSVPVHSQTCSEKGGIICSSSQRCSGTTSPSLEGTCCLGSCQEIPEENVCAQFGGRCASSCGEGESQTSLSCGNTPGLVCCELSESQDSGSNLTGLIIALVVLILLIVLAIIFRKKIKVWWFKFRRKRGGIKSSQLSPRGPPRAPPSSPLTQGVRRRVPFPVRKPQSRADKEMEETLGKLKEMAG